MDTPHFQSLVGLRQSFRRQKHRARDVMSQVTWEKGNSFIHYGGAELGMLDLGMMGFDQKLDDHLASNAFLFDSDAKALSTAQIRDDLAPIVFAKEGPTTFEDLYANLCNEIPGDAEIVKHSVLALAEANEITIRTSKGGRRESASRIHDTDVIERSRQISLFSLPLSRTVGADRARR